MLTGSARANQRGLLGFLEREFWPMKSGARLPLMWLLVLLLAVLPIMPAGGQARALYQSTDAQQKARALLDKMTPEERVGQLFLITMEGSSFDEKSQIYDLVVN